MTTTGRDCVKTQSWPNFGGGFTIPLSKKIAYGAILKAIFQSHSRCFEFSHNRGRLPPDNELENRSLYRIREMALIKRGNIRPVFAYPTRPTNRPGSRVDRRPWRSHLAKLINTGVSNLSPCRLPIHAYSRASAMLRCTEPVPYDGALEMQRALVAGQCRFVHHFRQRRMRVADACQVLARRAELHRHHGF